MEVCLHSFLTSAKDGGEWSARHLGSFTPRERAPNTYWWGDCVGLRADADIPVKRKISYPCQEMNHDSSVSTCKLVAIQTTLSQFLSPPPIVLDVQLYIYDSISKQFCYTHSFAPYTCTLRTQITTHSLQHIWLLNTLYHNCTPFLSPAFKLVVIQMSHW
jgi:hypothetical protein